MTAVVFISVLSSVVLVIRLVGRFSPQPTPAAMNGCPPPERTRQEELAFVSQPVNLVQRLWLDGNALVSSDVGRTGFAFSIGEWFVELRLVELGAALKHRAAGRAAKARSSPPGDGAAR